MWGIKVKDELGNSVVLTPEMTTIVKAKKEDTPAALNGDNTYGNNVDLSGTATQPVTNLGVNVFASVLNVDLLAYALQLDDAYYLSWFVNDDFDYYTRNESTGVLTAFTPNTSAATSYDGLLSVFPIAFWDKKGQTNVTSIDIFSSMCHLAYDQSATDFKEIHSLNDEGVEKITYAIYMKRYNE